MLNEEKVALKPRYIWPWILLAGVLLGIVLGVIWLTAEVRRVKEQRQYDFVPPQRDQFGLSAAVCTLPLAYRGQNCDRSVARNFADPR